MSPSPERSSPPRLEVVHAGEGTRLDVHGIVFSYKAIGEETEGRYALTEGVVPPHHGAPEHIHHREYAAFYLLEGEFEIECGGQTAKARPATFALLPKGLPHRFQNLSDKPGKVLCVQSLSGIEGFFEHMSLLAKAGSPDLEKIKELADRYEFEFLLQSGLPFALCQSLSNRLPNARTT